MRMQTKAYFATPVLMAEVEGAEALNAALLAAIMARRAADPAGLTHSNVLGWHSDTGMTEWGGEAAQALAKIAGDMCFAASRDLASPARPRFAWSVRMWANVAGAGASSQVHAHPGAFWSVVYYVADGGYAQDAAIGGELFLLDPRYPMSVMAETEMVYCGADGAPLAPEQRIAPRAGRLVAFPAWLMHGVRAYGGTGSRVSIAMNLALRRIA